MALTDIIFGASNSAVADRGDVGVLTDIMLAHRMSHRMTLSVPVVTDVKAGIIYGPQESLTGTFAGGGGARVVGSSVVRRISQ